MRARAHVRALCKRRGGHGQSLLVIFEPLLSACAEGSTRFAATVFCGFRKPLRKFLARLDPCRVLSGHRGLLPSLSAGVLYAFLILVGRLELAVLATFPSFLSHFCSS